MALQPCPRDYSSLALSIGYVWFRVLFCNIS